jgi:protein tyrosine/serine phosphatase
MQDAASPPRHPTRRAVLRGVGYGLVCAVTLEVGNVLVGPNCHAVIPGAVYRSSQPSAARLEDLIKKHGIRTVVNFRGVCETDAWYLAETKVSSRHGISEEDLNGVSAGRLPSIYTIRDLVDILDHGEYPILFHCNRGVDRTGMASVITLLLKTNTPVDEARKQLGLRYGHLSFGRTGQIDLFFDLYEEWLAQQKKTHSPDVFRHWMVSDYCPGECRADIVALDELTLLPEDAPHAFHIRCTNTSVRPWRMRPGPNAGVHAIFFVDDQDKTCVVQGRSGLFDAVVPVGESIDLTLAIPVMEPGNYVLRVDMTDEQHAKFHQVGSKPLFVPLEVR